MKAVNLSLSDPQQSSTPPEKTLPAGGSDPNHFDWQAVWYPVAYLEDLDQSQLTRFTLLEEDIVIWWDNKVQTWRVFADACPHRLVPLSEGRIAEDGLLECPYHGWKFAGNGECEEIPQQPQGKTAHQSPRSCVKSFPTQECQGLLFVYPGSPEDAAQTPVPLVDPLEEDGDQWVCLDTFRDVPYDTITLLENVLDVSHIPFTHHKSVSDRANAAPMDLEIVESSRQGFKGIWPEGPRKGKLGSQKTTFIAPALMWHDLNSKTLGRTMTVVYATPMKKGKCRVFARFPFQFASPFPKFFIKLTPRWYAHFGANAVLEDDQIFLYLQERTLATTGGSAHYTKSCYLPTSADRFVLAFHRWINTYNASLFSGQSFPSSESLNQGFREQLLERYHSHTENCSSCRTALKNIQKIRQILGIIIGIIWTITPVTALSLGSSGLPVIITLTILVFLSGGAWLGLGKLENNFYQGRTIPPRNYQN